MTIGPSDAPYLPPVTQIWQQAAAHSGRSSVAFSIVVIADSITRDVSLILAAGKIKINGIAKSLLGKLDAAAAALALANCGTAENIYSAFINELQAQGGKGVETTAAAIMIADAHYLIVHCS